MRCPAPLIALAAIALLGGCATDNARFPSLARRPAEKLNDAPEVVTSATASPDRVTGGAGVVAGTNLPDSALEVPSPDLSARLDQLVRQARTAHARFAEHRAHTAQLVAAGAKAAVASESWSVATVALADLESARSSAMIALADLDALYAAQRIAGSDAVAIGAARDQVMGWIGEEDMVLASLRGEMRG